MTSMDPRVGTIPIQIDRTTLDGNVYHYTTAEAIRHILSDQRFQVSHQQFMNDPNEASNIDEIMAEVLNRFWSTGESQFAQLLTRATKASHEPRTYAQDKFILSTSMSKDSLPLWTEYANKAGYCLGFSELHLRQWIKSCQILCLFGRVVYDREQQVKRLSDDLKRVERQLQNNPDMLSDQAILSQVFTSIVAAIEMYAMFFKDEAYKWEQEYRYCFTVNTGPDYRCPDTLFKTRHNVLIPYIEVDHIHIENSTHQLPLTSVRCGPTMTADNATDGMRRFLNTVNYHRVPISSSTVKVRF